MEAIPGAAVLFCSVLGWCGAAGVEWCVVAGGMWLRWQVECGSPRQCRTADGDG